VALCIKVFGDRVKNWMVLNEPMVFTGAGYFLGVHAPGKKGLTRFLSAVHHAALCQAEGGRIIRSLGSNFNIGTTFSCSHIDPHQPTEKDFKAAVKADALLNRIFVEPLLGLGYPVNELKILQRMETYIKSGDEKNIAFDMDFIGIQNYTREIVAHSYFIPFLKAKIIKADKRKVERTLMNWEVYPESIYHILKKFNDYKNIPQIIVTENGAAFEDQVTDGKVHDTRRLKYIQDHIYQILRAKKEGANVNGYFIWTLIDNFEWAEGFHPRFGLIYVNFSTNQRIIKSSGYWYCQFLQSIHSKSLVQKSREFLT
jgi:beta-glucosidase